MKKYFLARIKEPSTWKGIILLLTAVGIYTQPDRPDILCLGLVVVGVIEVFQVDRVIERLIERVVEKGSSRHVIHASTNQHN